MEKTRKLVMYALICALILLMAFTPIGYIKLGVVEITLIVIPVAVGAVMLGPFAGAIFGGLFGITSFIQCFGMSPFGAALLEINPLYTFLVCLVPRILTGLLCGLIFKGLAKVDKTKLISFATANLSCALLNTLFFISSLILLFGQTDYIAQLRGSLNVVAFTVAFVGLNGLIEAIVCFAAGTAISKALWIAMKR